VKWTADVRSALALGRPLEAFVSVANPTMRALPVVFRMAFSTGRTRSQRETVDVGGTVSVKMRALFGSQAADPAALLTGLTVTCDGGAVACPVAVSLLAAPTCEDVTP
jgi:hypothetical protein